MIGRKESEIFSAVVSIGKEKLPLFRVEKVKIFLNLKKGGEREGCNRGEKEGERRSGEEGRRQLGVIF